MLSKKSSFKLTLAVAATLSAMQAQSDTQSRNWDCSAGADGAWQCKSDTRTTDAPRPTRPTTSAPTAASEQSTEGPATPAGITDETGSISPGIAQPYAELDWYYYAAGETEPGSCPGRYVEPALDFATDTAPFGQRAIILEALRSSTQLGGVTELEGGINISQGDRSLSSESAQFDQTTRIASLSQNVRYREQGLLFVADDARADLNTGDTRFTRARYVLHPAHMRGSASQITRFGDERILLEQGAITFCDPSDNSWSIGAREIEIHTSEGYGEAYHAWFEVAEVPVLYLPYIYFPIDDTRRTGFLYPSISNSSSNGLDIAAPYYINLAPNFDDTITPRYISERGLMLENEFRYLDSWSLNTLSAGYLPDDQEYGDDRWLIGVDHRGTPQPRWFSRIDYTRTGDKDYLDDLDVTNLEISKQDDLNQLGEIRYQADTWQFITRVHQYQTLDEDPEPYEKVPQLLLTGREIAADERLDLRYLADYTYFDSKDQPTTGDRLHLRPSVGASWERPWGYVQPRLTYWLSQYDLDGQPAGEESNPSLTVPILSVDTGLRFERTLDSGRVQTLEPRAKYIVASNDDRDFIPEFDSSRLDLNYYNLFHETGYSGNDNVAGTDQVTLGLQSITTDRRGIEQLRLGIAQAYYFEDRDNSPGLRPGDLTGTETESNFAALASWLVTPSLRFSHDSEIDNQDGELVQQNYRLTYQPDNVRLLYLSFRDNTGAEFDTASEEEELRQTDFAFRWPVSPTWNVIGRWQQDLLHEENLETLLGVEYASCCWKLRLTGRQWVTDNDSSVQVERDTGVFLQFVLRGLGSFGDEGGREFLSDITGVNEDEHDKF